MPATPSPLAIRSAILGDLTVSPDAVYTLPLGLVGSPAPQRFALLPTERGGLFWFQSLEDPGLCLVLVDPFPLFPSYSVQLPAAEVARLRIASPAEALTLVTVEFPAEGEVAVACLRAPVILHTTRKTGSQVVLEGSDDLIRAEIPVADLLAAA